MLAFLEDLCLLHHLSIHTIFLSFFKKFLFWGGGAHLVVDMLAYTTVRYSLTACSGFQSLTLSHTHMQCKENASVASDAIIVVADRHGHGKYLFSFLFAARNQNISFPVLG